MEREGNEVDSKEQRVEPKKVDNCHIFWKYSLMHIIYNIIINYKMLTRSLLKRMNKEDRNLVKEGAIFTGGISYFNYREWIKKDFMRSEGHYRFNSRTENCTPWKQLYFTWWRMPDEEFNVYHRFKPYFIIGQLDSSKEILIPAVHTDPNGNT